MEERDNVLRILKDTKQAIEAEDSNTLKELSNQTIHTASIYQDPDNIAVAVIVYALSKIIERKNYRDYRNWPKFFSSLKLCVSRSISALEKGQDDYFRAQIECIRRNINSLSGGLKKNIEEVFRKAEINKASRIYEHGISMQQTAKLLGISIWELAEYAGSTGISDVNLTVTLPVRTRIKNASNFFEK